MRRRDNPQLTNGLSLLRLSCRFIDNNQLTGSIPAWSIPNLVEALLYDNYLTGMFCVIHLGGWAQCRPVNADAPIFTAPAPALCVVATGTIPAWDTPRGASIAVMPQRGVGLCGQVSLLRLVWHSVALRGIVEGSQDHAVLPHLTLPLARKCCLVLALCPPSRSPPSPPTSTIPKRVWATPPSSPSPTAPSRAATAPK